MDNLDWQLWGTFSVVDHLRPDAFVSDVLVYNRLVVPVPPDDAVDAWEQGGWQPGRQRTILDILKDGDRSRVEEIPWEPERRTEYRSQISRMKSNLAAGAAIDVPAIQSLQPAGPDTLQQLATRMALVDYRSEQRDRAMIAGIPPSPVDIVAAYGSEEEFTGETGATPANDPASPVDLLGAFAWPFAVPAEDGGADLDTLKRAVEYANQPQVQQHRQAFHRWRGKMVREGKSPADAVEDLQDEIDAYASWARTQGQAQIIRRACVVAVAGAGVAAAVLPLIGLPIAAAVVGAAAVGTPFFGEAVTKHFRGRLKTYNPAHSPGALFWEAQHFH